MELKLFEHNCFCYVRETFRQNLEEFDAACRMRWSRWHITQNKEEEMEVKEEMEMEEEMEVQ